MNEITVDVERFTAGLVAALMEENVSGERQKRIVEDSLRFFAQCGWRDTEELERVFTYMPWPLAAVERLKGEIEDGNFDTTGDGAVPEGEVDPERRASRAARPGPPRGQRSGARSGDVG